MLKNIYKPNPNSILIQYYLDKVKKDAEELSKGMYEIFYSLR